MSCVQKQSFTCWEDRGFGTVNSSIFAGLRWLDRGEGSKDLHKTLE